MRVRGSVGVAAIPLLAVVAVSLSACESAPGSNAAPTGSEAGITEVLTSYSLSTQCGVREARIGGDYYEASPVIDDGQGNPPAGWDSWSQVGTMTVYNDGTARFNAGKGREALFLIRPGATAWLQICS